MEVILSLIIALVLCFLSIQDLRYKEINIVILILMFVVGLIYKIYCGDFLSILLGGIPGLICMLFAKLSKMLGMGDAWLLLSVGVIEGMVNVIIYFMVSLFFASIIGVLVLVIKKKGKDYEMPFVPFFLVGFVIGKCII